ncbi:MAG: hypothetical protein ACR2K2_00680 [Mycobacteriales bacterium]
MGRVEADDPEAEVQGVAQHPFAHPVQAGVRDVLDGQADRSQRQLHGIAPGVGAPAAYEQPVGEPGAAGRRLGVVAGEGAAALPPRHPHLRRAGEQHPVRGRLEVQVVQHANASTPRRSSRGVGARTVGTYPRRRPRRRGQPGEGDELTAPLPDLV